MTARAGLPAILVAAIALTGCASVPSGADSGRQQGKSGVDPTNEFHDGTSDVQFATEFPVESAEEAIERADRTLAKGESDLALYYFVQAADLDPENVYVLFRIGEIHASRGNVALAQRALQAAIDKDPQHARALQALGLIYLRAGSYDEAYSLLERATAVDPMLWRSYNGIGVIADMRGDHAAAVKAFDAGLAARPDDSALLNNRGYSYYLDGQVVEATTDFTRAAAKGSQRAWLNLGLVLARQRQYEQAVQAMTRAVEPEFAYNDVGYIASRQDDTDVATAYFEKAIQLAPRYFEEAERNLAHVRNEAPGDDDGEAGIVRSVAELQGVELL